MKCKRTSCKKQARKNTYRGHVPSYCSKACKNVDKVHDLRKRRKQEAVTYLGGACRRCGYSKCLEALQFHHRDPKRKDFVLSAAMTRSFTRIKAELDKCDLLCANCHAEVHTLP